MDWGNEEPPCALARFWRHRRPSVGQEALRVLPGALRRVGGPTCRCMLFVPRLPACWRDQLQLDLQGLACLVARGPRAQAAGGGPPRRRPVPCSPSPHRRLPAPPARPFRRATRYAGSAWTRASRSSTPASARGEPGGAERGANFAGALLASARPARGGRIPTQPLPLPSAEPSPACAAGWRTRGAWRGGSCSRRARGA